MGCGDSGSPLRALFQDDVQSVSDCIIAQARDRLVSQIQDIVIKPISIRNNVASQVLDDDLGIIGYHPVAF